MTYDIGFKVGGTWDFVHLGVVPGLGDYYDGIMVCATLHMVREVMVCQYVSVAS